MQQFVNTANQLGATQQPFFFCIDYALQNYWMGSAQEAAQQEIYFQFPKINNVLPNAFLSNIDLQPHPISAKAFQKSFDVIQQHIKYGNTFLCNLTATTPISTNATLQQIFATAKAKYKVLYKNEWTCFSPEIFIQIENNTISTYPMKGTIDANLPQAEQQILANPKEKAEHYTIVDLLRNDIGSVAKNVQVQKFRYADTIATKRGALLQISSKITGELPTNWQQNIGSILLTMLPAGSISGAPKQKTLEIIAEAETHQRGFYTGIAGYFDGSTLDTCVLIRFIQNNNNELVYKSGGGITCNSIAAEEYAELQQKIYIPTL